MFLKPVILDRAKRLELLVVLHPCFWRWYTRLLLEPIAANLVHCLSADAPGRCEIIENALQSMTRRMADYQVVGFRMEQKLELMRRTDSKRLNAKARDVFRHHPFMNPSSRRSAEQNVRLLLDDVRTGKLLRACEALGLA